MHVLQMSAPKVWHNTVQKGMQPLTSLSFELLNFQIVIVAWGMNAKGA